MEPAGRIRLHADYLQRQRHLFRNAVLRISHDLTAAHDADPAAPPLEAMTYLYAYHWLRRRAPAQYHAEILAASRNPEHAYLIPMLLESPDGAGFTLDYLDYWQARKGSDPRSQAVGQWLKQHQGDLRQAATALFAAWQRHGWFQEEERDGVRRLLRRQQEIHRQVLGQEDRERLALLDGLPDPGPQKITFPKVGLVPRMTCGVGCRHCQFVWRPRLDTSLPVGSWLDQAQSLSPHLLFTGGDLTPSLGLIQEAIATLPRVATFALLLNGATAKTRETAREFLAALENALAQRPAGAVPAGVLLQVSFDEWHQEILPHRQDGLRERIPVERIANLLEAATAFPHIQLVLLHKQERLNFTQEFFRQGVVSRLGRTLRERGLGMHVAGFNQTPAPKENPAQPDQTGPLIAEVAFHLEGRPERLFFLTSSTIDGYGRAALLDPGTGVEERREVRAWGAGGGGAGRCDTDLMLWRDGRVTLFHAPHLALGNTAEDGLAQILARWRKDPLRRAVAEGDPRLLEAYRRWGGEERAATLLAQATSLPHLIWLLTEEAAARLFMTRTLLAD